MDNVTHALAGLLLAEAAWQARRPRAGADGTPGLRAVAVGAAAVAANLPDVDVLYNAAARLDKLHALLAHRGYTHTLLAAALGAALVWAGALALLTRRARGAVPPRDRRWLLGLVAAAALSHLALDWTNDYGVHPFTPFDNGWRYGDAVFIVEPWLWVVSVPVLVAAARRPAARGALALVLLGGLGLAWGVALVPRAAALALTLGAGGWLAAALARRAGPRAGIAAWVLVELAFFAGTRAARANVRAAARAAAPGATPVDLVTTPQPGNPLCARAIVVQTEAGRYEVATGWASALPAVVPAARCAGAARAPGGPGLAAAPGPGGSDGVRWDRRWDAPLAELVALGTRNCVAAAALRFIRVPVWARVDAATVRLGDLRYGGGAGGLADFDVPVAPRSCPAGVPPWTPPRQELIGGG